MRTPLYKCELGRPLADSGWLDKPEKIALNLRPPGGPHTMPTLKLIPDYNLGGKIVQETCVTFDATISNTVIMMPQS